MKFKQFEINLKGQAAILLTEFQFTITLFNIGNPSLFIDSLSCYAILLFSAVFILATGKCKVRGSKGWSSQKEVNKKCMLHMQNSFIFSHVIRWMKVTKEPFPLNKGLQIERSCQCNFFFLFWCFHISTVCIPWVEVSQEKPSTALLSYNKKIDINLNLQLFAVCC